MEENTPIPPRLSKEERQERTQHVTKLIDDFFTKQREDRKVFMELLEDSGLTDGQKDILWLDTIYPPDSPDTGPLL